MTYPTGPQLRDHLNDRLDLVFRIAEKRRQKGEEQIAFGMEKAVRMIRHQVIGEGAGCVITALDPRRDDPLMAEALAGLRAVDNDPSGEE